MNIKDSVVEMAKFSITPFPHKYHYEGVNNRRAGINFTIATVALNAAIFTAPVYGPAIVNGVINLKNRVQNRFKKD